MASSRRGAAMPFIMVTVLLDMMSIGIIAPVLPKLIGSFMDSGASTSMAYGAAQAAFAIAQFFSAPVLGALSDRYGRRPILLLGLLGMGINFFVTALASEFWMLLAVRVMGGAVCANIAVANAYVADITVPEDRAKNYGMLGAMFGLGFILGPVLGGTLGSYDLHWPFLLAGSLSLLNCLYGYFVLPESLPLDKRRKFELAQANPFTALARLKELKGVETLMWIMGLSILAQFCLHTSWFLYTEFKFGWTPMDNGLSLLVVGGMAVVVQGGLMRVVQNYIPLHKLVTLGLVSSTIAFAGYGLVPVGWMLFVVVVANVFGYMVQPGLQSLVSNAVDPTRQGESMGAVSSINSVAAVLGPLLGTPLLAAVSHYPQGDWRVGAPFYLCAAIQGVAAVIGWRYFSRTYRAPGPVATAV
ncbi:MFS transporter [Aquabacterium sp.]|uniref:MFS transporter n=1 Tax=Aquabacterium sp. TaxID=1872578 RepID=UPI00248A58E8|nr:MFS transporter [Aquabacterium sp.]MDI1261357.1 MFS transporter [Aquabacterium sp.]